MQIKANRLVLKDILFQNSVELLKEFCRGKNLSPTGTKEILVDRILENEDDSYELKDVLKAFLKPSQGCLKSISQNESIKDDIRRQISHSTR